MLGLPEHFLALASGAYIEARALIKTPATVSRRLAGIGRIHRLLGHANPAASDLVALALRRVVRSKGRRQEQAAGLSAKFRDELIAACGHDPRGLRDQAMIAVGYDTLCRRSELVQLRADDIERLAAGDASILIRRSKTDQAGDGRLGYLSAETVRKVERWTQASGISVGPLFRAVRGSTLDERPLHAYAVSRTLKMLAKKAGPAPTLCEQLSGHSMRVGAALDMAENGIDLDHARRRLEITQHGRPLHQADQPADVGDGATACEVAEASTLRSVG